MIRLELNRKSQNHFQTLGFMDVYKNGYYRGTLATIELGWQNNILNVSCIGPGPYPVELFSKEKHNDCFILRETNQRTAIFIDSCNCFKDLAGSIGVGLYHEYLSNEPYYQCKESKVAIERLRLMCENEKHILLIIS